MKLHLPKMLTAALLAAFTTVGFTLPQAQAGTEYNGVTYSGYIYNVMNASNNLFHNAKFTNYYWNGEAWVNSQQWAGDGSTYYTGTESHQLTGGDNSFWRRNFGDANQGDAKLLGNTIRLASATSNVYYEAQFSPYQIGGIIAEAGNDGMYVLGRTNKSCEMRLKAQEGADFNVYAASNLGLSSNTGITVYNGGTWNVQSGKSLTLALYTNTGNVGAISNTPYITFEGGVAVNMIGGGTVDLTHTNALTVGQGATISVGADTTLLLASNTTLGGTITSAGTVTFSGNTVALTESLTGFDSVEKGHYVDHSSEEAQNGYYAGSTEYTLVDGAYTGLTSATHGGNTYTVTDGKITIGSAGDTDWTTYHLRTSGASVNVGTEKGYHAELAKVVQGTGTTVDLGGATLATLEGATNGEAMKLAGTGTITTLAKTGVLDMQSGASVTVPNLNVTSDMGTYSTGAGKLVIDTVTTNNNGVIEFDSATKLGTVHMTGGNVTFGGTGLHEVTTLGLSQTGTQISTVNVAKDATLHIVGTAVAYNRDTRFSGSFSLSHWNAANVVNVYGKLISDVVVSSCDGTGTINVYEGGRLEMRDGLNRGLNNDNAITINVENGATLAAGTTHNTEQTKDSDKMVVSLAGGSTFEAYYGNDATAIINKTLTFGEGTVTIDAGAEGKTMTLNSNLTVGATIDKTGEGELVLAGAGNVLGHAITLSEGTLTMTGTFNIDALEVSGEETTWERAEGIAEGSGFKKVSGTITVVSKDDSTTLNAAGATVTREGERVELADTGIVSLGGAANYTTLWVNNTGDVSYNVAQGLAGEVNVGTVHLNYEGATVTMDKADAAVDIVVADGVNAGVKATQNTTINSITGLGADKTITISGEGTVSLSQDPVITASNVAVNGGHLELGGARHMITLSVTNGTVTTTHSGGNPCISGTLTINEGGVFTVAGTNQDAFGYTSGDTSNMDIYLAGKDGNHAVLALNQQTQSTVTMSANLHFGGYADVTSTSTGFNTFGGQISVTGVDNTITNMQLRKAVTVTVAEEGVLTINNMTRFGGFSDGLTKEGAGKLVFDGTNVLDKTIQVNAGSLELNGTYSIGGIEDVASYSYDGGAEKGNGFMTTTTTKTLYALADGASGSIGDGAVIKIGETDVTESVKDGVYTTSSRDDSVFFVNTGTEAVSQARTSQNLTGIMMLGDNTTLTVDEDIAATEVEAYGSDVTLNIGEGKKVTGQVSGFILDGTGTYAISGLNNATATLGTGVSLANSWAGTVKFSSCTNLKDIDLNNLGKNGSAVEFDGVTGYFAATGTGRDFANKLVLSGAGLEILNGSTTRTYTFSGGVEGTGDFIYSMRNGANDQTYVFNANVKDWTGAFKSTNGGKTTTLKFLVGATEMGAAIVRSAGTLNIEVGDGSTGFATTFDQAVGATTLDVKASAEATVKGALVASTANVNGKLTVAGVDSNIATLNLAGDFAVAEGGSVTLGTVSVSGEATMDNAGTAALTSVIALGEAASLTMTGRYDISALGDVSVIGYVKEDGQQSTNGYGIEDGEIQVVNVGEGSLTSTGATFYHGTATGTLEDSTGMVHVNGVNYSKYYVNGGDETLSEAKQHAELASIKVAEDAVLVVDEAMGTSLLAAESTGTVNIGTGVVVTVDSAAPAVKLAGTGTYAMGSANIGQTELGDNWHGAVSLSGFAFSNTSLDDLWQGDSWVEMNGITGGYLSAWNGGGSESANIRLTNPGEDGIAWNWSQGTSTTAQPTITFDGKWEGTGTFQLTDLRENVTFAGDISGWKGTFDYSGNHGSTLTFKDDATVINVAIENNGVNDATDANKQFHIAVENEAVFNKEVASHTLTIADDASATFHQAEMELASLTLGDDAATMTVWSDELAAAEGTVTITETLTAGEGSILHSNLDLKDGVVLAFNDTLTMTSTLGVEGLLTLDEDSALFLELVGLPEGSGQWVDLIMAGDGSNLVYTNPGIHRANAADVFTNSLFQSGDYMVFATEDSFGITRVPEPTTGTLSLLALAALAARRRKH